VIRTTIVLCSFWLLSGCSENSVLPDWIGQFDQEPEPAGTGLIRDGKAAISIAMHAYLSMRQQDVDSETHEAWESAHEATLDRGVWTVAEMTFPSFPSWGLVFYISASDGRIIGISHRSPDGSTMLPLRIDHRP